MESLGPHLRSRASRGMCCICAASQAVRSSSIQPCAPLPLSADLPSCPACTVRHPSSFQRPHTLLQRMPAPLSCTDATPLERRSAQLSTSCCSPLRESPLHRKQHQLRTNRRKPTLPRKARTNRCSSKRRLGAWEVPLLRRDAWGGRGRWGGGSSFSRPPPPPSLLGPGRYGRVEGWVWRRCPR